MENNWKLWCRLCAYEDSRNIDINKFWIEFNFPEALNSLLSLNIPEASELGNMICLNCNDTVKKIIEFSQKVSRVQMMFLEILNGNGSLDAEEVKAQHKIDDEFDQKLLNIKPMDTFYEPEICSMLNPSDEMVDIFETSDIKLEPNEVYLEKTEPVSWNEVDDNNEDIDSKTDIGQTIDKSDSVRRPDTPNSMTSDVTCSYCKKTYSSLCNLRRHLRQQHEASTKMYTCEKCGKICRTIQRLEEHKLAHDEGQQLKCKQCDKCFKNKLRLKYHEDTHSTTSYICTICGIRLNSKPTLRRHMVVHSDQKRFKCNYCGNEFKRAKALKTHLILHTGLKPYSCEFCDRTFANNSNCRSHKKKSHPLELAAMEAAGKTTNHTKLPQLKDLQASLPTSYS